MKKVAVVILNWNGAAMLQRFLPSVVRCSEGRDVEVCVADNGSTDLSCRVVETEFPTVRLIRLSRNYGFAEGYNRAICQVEAEYVVLLNSDVEVTEGWLDPLMAYMETHPDAAACQPKLLSERQRDTFEYAGAAGGFIDRYGYPFCRGRLFDGVEKDEGQYDAEMSVFWASGAALFVRRRVYQEVGGLDEAFTISLNDVDFCLRLLEKGLLNVFTPFAELYHFESISRGLDDQGEKAERYNRESAMFKEKWKEILEKGDPYYNPNFSLDRSDYSLRMNESMNQ